MVMEDFKEVDISVIERISNDYPNCELEDYIACYAWSEENRVFVACDNTMGDAFIEEFRTMVGVTAYLGLSLKYQEALALDTVAHDGLVLQKQIVEKAKKYDEENIKYKKKFEAQLQYIATLKYRAKVLLSYVNIDKLMSDCPLWDYNELRALKEELENE